MLGTAGKAGFADLHQLGDLIDIRQAAPDWISALPFGWMATSEAFVKPTKLTVG